MKAPGAWETGLDMRYSKCSEELSFLYVTLRMALPIPTPNIAGT